MKRTNIVFTVTCLLIFFTSLSASARPPGRAIDKAEILKAKGVTASFVLLKADSAWHKTNANTRRASLLRAQKLMEQYADRVVVDVYETSGLAKDEGLLLRLHAYKPGHNGEFIRELLSPRVLAHYFVLQDVRMGITRGLNYAPKFPGLLAKLKEAKYEGAPPVFGIMMTVDKTPEWWNLSKDKKLEMIKEHTAKTLPFIKDVKRKLYHSTGLGETDFITYFETSNLKAFNDLMITLKSVKEGKYTTYGTPVMGFITTFDQILK